MRTNTRWLIFGIMFCLALGQGASYAVGASGQGSGFLGVIFIITGAAILLGPGENE